jgi:Tol biopolymer transport system component
LLVPGKAVSQGSPTLSRDGKKLYYRGRVSGSQEFAVFERDLSSGDERELIRRPLLGPAPMDLSPDGRFIATGAADPLTKSSAAILVPVAGGEPRELMRAELPQMFGVAAWAPDSRSVLVARFSPASGQGEAWLVSLDGESRKLDLGLDPQTSQQLRGQLRVHPDGRRVAFEISGPRKPVEIWVLENFLPPLRASK